MKLSAQLLLVAACLLLTAFSTGEESTQEVLITPFAVVDPDEVVAEAAVAEEALVQIKTAIPIPDHMPLSDALQNSPYNNPGAMSAGVYQYDDNDDREARQNPAGWVNSQGLNKMTGQAPVAYDGKIIVDGMSEADHITSTPTMGRDYVTKGYTTEDAKTSSDGHYYIGSGRRRIGAGFGRRRAAVEIPITSEEQKAESDKMMKELFSDPTKSAVFDDFAHMLRSSYQQDKGTEAMKPMTEEEKAKVVAELYGLTHGPQFFEKQNYKGKHIMVQKKYFKREGDRSTREQNDQLHEDSGRLVRNPLCWQGVSRRETERVWPSGSMVPEEIPSHPGKQTRDEHYRGQGSYISDRGSH